MIILPQRMSTNTVFMTMMIILMILPQSENKLESMDFVYSNISNLTRCSKLYMKYATNSSLLHNCLIGDKNHTVQYICEDRHFDLLHLVNLNYRKKQEKIRFLKVSCKKLKGKCVCGKFESNQFQLSSMNSKSSPATKCVLQELIKEYFQDLTDIEFLDISWNDITSILPDLFHDMTKLVYLDISHNPLHNPSNFLFYLFNLRDLVVLKMNSDFDNNTEIKMQRKNCSVYFLEMSENNFSHAALSAIVNTFSTIDILFLNNNRIVAEDFQSLPKIPNLLVLNFANNSLSLIPNHFFTNNSDLVVLDLSKNGITDFKDNTFFGLSRLRVLALSFNNISQLRKEIFEPLVSLEYLLLNHNQIQSLNIDVFTFSGHLHSLMLYENHISSINGSFSAIQSLKSLDLSNNKLKHISKANYEGCTHLQYLYLNKNEIIQIEKDSFRDMNSLFELNMYGNEITNISQLNSLLSPLRNLTIIRFDKNSIEAMPDSGILLSNIILFQATNNKLQVIKSGTFTGMHSLEMLYLGNNNIHTIEPGSFPLSLKILNLTGNKLRTINTQFNNLNSLEYLVITHNHITDFAKGALKNLPNLITLNLCHNDIRRIPPNTFYYLRNLEDLILCRNNLNIDFRKSNPFSGLVKLKGLDLAYNNISSIDGLLTSSQRERCSSAQLVCKTPLFRHLSELYLTHNNIRMIDYRLWNKNEFVDGDEEHSNIRLVLDTLDLRGNKINHIDQNAFYDISISPLKIHLQYNQLQTLEPQMISDDTDIILDKNPILCDCHMRWLKETNGTTQVTTRARANYINSGNYHLTYCEVLWRPKVIKLFKDVDLSEFLCPAKSCYPKCNCFTTSSNHDTEVAFCIAQNFTLFPAVPVSIKHLDVQFNNFSIFSTVHLLNQTFMIEKLNLSYSGIMSLENKSFSIFPYLRVLDLQKNKLKHLKDGLFTYNSKIEILYLNGNNILMIHSYLFKSLRNLKQLYLHENKIIGISSVAVSMLKLLPLQTVTLQHNDLSCTCDNKALFEWLVIKSTVSDAHSIELTCENSTAVLWKTKISAALLQCPQYQVGSNLTVIVTVICSMSAFFIVLFVIWYFRARIFTLLYPLTQRFYSKLSVSTLYDGYLSYSEEDLGWITKEFLPKMENKKGNFKFCLEDRDFTPGGNKAESVYHCISESRKVIFFISSSFLENEWCLFELECAHRRYLLEQKKRLVAVFLQTISKDDIPKDIKVYITNAQKLYRFKPFFWDKLFLLLAKTKSHISLKSENIDSAQSALLIETVSDSLSPNRTETSSSKLSVQESGSLTAVELSTSI